MSRILNMQENFATLKCKQLIFKCILFSLSSSNCKSRIIFVCTCKKYPVQNKRKRHVKLKFLNKYAILKHYLISILTNMYIKGLKL